MKFSITHRTCYRYAHPATEAYGEVRLVPPDTGTQTIGRHAIATRPEASLSRYVDAFGNEVGFFSLPFRHQSLTLTNSLTVSTKPTPLPEASLALTVGEARQILRADLVRTYDYLEPTPAVPHGREAALWARRHLPGRATLGEALESLNHAVHRRLRYEPGATDQFTPLRRVWSERRGVCQDFAHLMLSVLRSAGIPSRYVCGYVEAAPPHGAPDAPSLVGALATHAWVEALVPGMFWIPLDPTNDTLCGEQHVAVSYGRDARDAAPFRGTFKGAGSQRLSVNVTVQRLQR